MGARRLGGKEASRGPSRSRRASWPPSLLASLVALATLPACEATGARPTTTVQASDSADQILEGFSHYVTNQGVRRSRVEADTAYFYENTQITELRRVKVTFYNIKGEESSTLTSRTGTYRWQDGAMEANGNVVVVSPDGRRLATPTLKYDNATNTISTDKPFTFDDATQHLKGNSFRSDPDFRNVVTDQPSGVAGKGMLLPGQAQEDSQ
jgi:LPS export ABC transporter protein LptC